MKTNKKQIIIIIVMMLLVMGSIFGFIKGKDLFPETNVWNDKKEDIETDVKEEKVYDEKVTYEMGDEIILGKYVYKINSVEKTKKKGNFPAPTNRTSFSFDENGNLVDDNSYLIINMSIKQTSEQSEQIFLNEFRLDALDNNDQLKDPVECISISKFEEIGNKNYFKVELEPNKEYTYDIAFAAKDEFLEYNNFKFEIRRRDPEDGNENKDQYRYINIKY